MARREGEDRSWEACAQSEGKLALPRTSTGIVTRDAKRRLVLSSRRKTDRNLRTVPLLPVPTVAALHGHRRLQREYALGPGPGYARDLEMVFPNELGGP